MVATATTTICLLPLLLFTLAEPKPSYGKSKGVGMSTIFRNQDYKGNYDFGYDITDADGATNFRREAGDAKGNVVGSYGLTDVDGRTRLVEYAADKYGFTAAIKTNEPGTSDDDAADAIYNGVDKNKKSFGYTVEFTDEPAKDDGKYKDGFYKAAAVESAASKFKQQYAAAASENHDQYVAYEPLVDHFYSPSGPEGSFVKPAFYGRRYE